MSYLIIPPEFENDVKMYGIQTLLIACKTYTLFENDVKMYGIQTAIILSSASSEFENDVKMYGIQTRQNCIDKDC